MQTEVNKWGDALAIRIPKHMAEALNLAEGHMADLTMQEGRIVLTPRSTRPKKTLEGMIASVEAAGGYGDIIDSGPDVGNEVCEW